MFISHFGFVLWFICSVFANLLFECWTFSHKFMRLFSLLMLANTICTLQYRYFPQSTIDLCHLLPYKIFIFLICVYFIVSEFLFWLKKIFKTSLVNTSGASLVAQWLRIHLPMQGTQVRALVREKPTCHGATKPVHHNYWVCALEPTSHNYRSPHATTTEAHAPRTRAPQQKKPPQEAHAPQRREIPARRN